jgi:hypothetical protein
VSVGTGRAVERFAGSSSGVADRRLTVGLIQDQQISSFRVSSSSQAIIPERKGRLKDNLHSQKYKRDGTRFSVD